MAHMTVAVSEGAFRRSFDLLQRNLIFEKADSTSFGAFTAGYDVKAHLEGGSIDLRSDGTIQVRELDLRWDRLRFTLGLNIPELCVGGGCIDMPWPIPDICLPRVCIFSGDPDISISPDLAAFVAQEVSFTARLVCAISTPRCRSLHRISARRCGLSRCQPTTSGTSISIPRPSMWICSISRISWAT